MSQPSRASPPLKSRLEELALFGGAPAFEEKLHVGRPNIGDRERLRERLEDILDRRWLTNDGPYVQEFEREIAQRLGVRQCVAMCNATVALEIAIRALELDGEVIVPSFTHVATAHALQWQAITPVFCDIAPGTHTIDASRVEAMITPRTTGILGVHVWGRPCDVEALSVIAERRRLKLLFDAAHAFGCSYRGRMLGNFGHAEVLSFHATKFCNAFEGGAVTTNDTALAEKMRLMRNFGFSDYDHVSYIGTNGKMSEISAAMGLTSLESLDALIATNLRNYRQYVRELRDVPGIVPIEYDERERANFQYVVVEVDERSTGVRRDEIQKILWAENVMARRYFYPGCHRMEPYRSYFPHAGLLLPDTESLVERVLALPTGTAVSPRDIDAVCQIIRLAVAESDALRRRMALCAAS